MEREPLVRDISDTALWVAHYRAQESDRPDAQFRDPFARALAGERGAKIAKAQTFADQNAWSFMARPVLVDRFITDGGRGGRGPGSHPAPGPHTRPDRSDLPTTPAREEMELTRILPSHDG